MSCEEYRKNISELMGPARAVNISYDKWVYTTVRDSLFHIGLPIICAFGIVGNILNLLILTRKQLQRSMDRMEKSVHMGLVALAVSDMFFCFCMFPKSFLNQTVLMQEDQSPSLLYYSAYYEPFINIFLMSSTWLTVTMASGRYIAICHPLHARWIVDIRATRISILAVFIISVLFNLPAFWKYNIVKSQCAIHCKCYAISVGDLYEHSAFVYIYSLLWAIIGVFIPLFILAFCNICLIRALQHSRRMRRLYRANHTPHDDSGHRLTPTLISIVILFMVFVTPSEIFKFVSQHIDITSFTIKQYYTFAIMQEVVNFSQAINFTINFVLYCVINVHFRKTIAQIFCCRSQKSEVFKFNNITTTMNMSEAEPL